MKKIILLISGKKGSGKTTLARLISESLTKQNIPNCHINFADPLKHFVCRVYNFTQKELEEKKERYRALLQLTGDRLKELNGQNYFANDFVNRVIDALNNWVIICSDWRFVNESEVVESMKSVEVIKIHVEYTGNYIYPADHHISENGLNNMSGEDFDFNIQNNGVDLQHLQNEAEKMVKYIKEKQK